jgi:hypothetical protein
MHVYKINIENDTMIIGERSWKMILWWRPIIFPVWLAEIWLMLIYCKRKTLLKFGR